MSAADDSVVKLTLLRNVKFVRIPIDEKDKACSPAATTSGRPTGEKNSKQRAALLLRFRRQLSQFTEDHSRQIRNVILLIVFVAYFVYYGFAMAYSVSAATALTVGTCIGLALIVFYWINEHYGEEILESVIRPGLALFRRHWPRVRWIVFPVVAIGSIVYLFVVVIDSLRQIRSLVGAMVFLLLPYFTSKSPHKVQWQMVGIVLYVQFLLGIIVLRWPAGFEAVNFLFRELFRLFLYYPMAGAATVYGDPWFFLHAIAMYVSSLIIYVICLGGVLYHLFKVLRVIRFAKGWLPYATDAQLHLGLVSSHALVSGYALAFVSICGENVHHMVTGMILCAPAGIAISLMHYPSTEKNTYSWAEHRAKEAKQPKSSVNIFEVAAQGSILGAKAVGLVYANVLAFTSFYALVDSAYAWLAGRVGIQTDIVGTLGYVFAPVSYLMGVRWEDCYFVGCIVADKTFGLVLRAFRDLGWEISLNRMQNDTAVIATHAVLGFSVFGTMAAWMGLFRAISPNHRARIMSIFPRVMFCASMACFYAASIAVVLSPESEYESPGTTTSTRTFLLWILKSLPSYKELMSLAAS